MAMRILVVGKKHEPWVSDGIERYEKRLKRPFTIEWLLLPHSAREGVSARQEEIAKSYIEQLTAAHVFKERMTTQVVRLPKFYPAEEYHQDFARKNPNHRYIRLVDMPKVEDLRLEFAALYVK